MKWVIFMETLNLIRKVLEAGILSNNPNNILVEGILSNNSNNMLAAKINLTILAKN